MNREFCCQLTGSWRKNHKFQAPMRAPCLKFWSPVGKSQVPLATGTALLFCVSSQCNNATIFVAYRSLLPVFVFTVSIETVKSKTQPCSSVEKIFFLMQEDMNMKRNFGNIEILRKKINCFPRDQSLSVYYYCFIFNRTIQVSQVATMVLCSNIVFIVTFLLLLER